MASIWGKNVSAHKVLDEIADLEYNWNENGAEPFPSELVCKCRNILCNLSNEPFMSPTAYGSIQFEYEKDCGDYLEFEIFQDKIKVYYSSAADGEREYVLTGTSALNTVKQMVETFCG